MNTNTQHKQDKPKKLSNCAYCAQLGKTKQYFAPYNCRCGKEFCIKHLQPEVHMCTYNYRDMEHKKEMLSKLVGLSTVKPRKIAPI